MLAVRDGCAGHRRVQRRWGRPAIAGPSDPRVTGHCRSELPPRASTPVLHRHSRPGIAQP